MKSTKHSIELRKSLSKRQPSSRQGLHPHSQRQLPEHKPLVKSTTLRLFSAKDIKINNLFPERDTRTSKTARGGPKKKAVRTVERNPHEQLLLKKSDKMKLVFWSQDPALILLKPIVVSADFIVNQDLFWEKDKEKEKDEGKGSKGEPPAIVKDWRQLHKNYFVVWTVRSRRSWARVQQHISTHSLPVHALFLVKKKRSYTVDYSGIARELERQRTALTPQVSENRAVHRCHEPEDCLTIFETVKVNLRDLVDYSSYGGRVPVLFGSRAKVILMRIEGEPPGIDCVFRCLQKCKKPQSVLQGEPFSFATCRMIKINPGRRRYPELYPCFSVRNFIMRYLGERRREEWQQREETKRGKEPDWFYEQEQIDDRIEGMKRRLIDSLIASHGRQFQFEGGLSIYNFVGQMFKRNHRILFNQLVESMYAEQPKLQPRQPFPEEEGYQLDLQVDYYELDWK